MPNLLAPPIEYVILYFGILAAFAYSARRLVRHFIRRGSRARVEADRTIEIAALDARLRRMEDQIDNLRR